MNEELVLKNHLKEVRTEKKLSQAQLAEMVGVSRNTISSIETGQFNPTAKLALILCIALDKKFEELLVDDTGFTEEEKQEAINKAYEKIDDIIDSMKF